MTTTQLIRYRLRAQHLVPPYFTKPVDVVEWMGAVQAQDYLGALWSVGQRLKKSVEADVEEAIAKKEIVRTWPMRGTLHFVAPKDSRWMLQYLTPRVFARIASVLRKDEIDEKVLAKSTKALINALEGRKPAHEAGTIRCFGTCENLNLRNPRAPYYRLRRATWCHLFRTETG